MSPVIGGLIVGVLGLCYGLLAGNDTLHKSNPVFWKSFKTIGAIVLLAALILLVAVPFFAGWGR